MDCKDSELLADELAAFYSRWLDGSLSETAADLFAVARAVLIPKEGGGLRPLGIGDPWYRLGAQIVAARVTSTVAPRLAPLQLGGGTRAGCEIAARTMQLALDRDHGEALDVCVFSLDIRNAFNTLRRSHILQGIRAHCPELEPYFRLFYGRATELRLSNGAPATLSSTGVRQGDPLAMLLFALGFHEALEQLQLAHRRALSLYNMEGGPGEGHIIAYADDVGGSLPAAAMAGFCQEAVDALARFDLHLVPQKCGIHERLANRIITPLFPIMPQGLRKVLGCPVGGPSFRASILSESIERMTLCIPDLLKLGCYTAYTLLTRCVNQRAQYLARVLEAPDIHVQLQIFDRCIDMALATIIDCSAEDRNALCIVRCLPQRLGGLGVYRHSGPEGACGRNSSRNATFAYIRTSLPRTFYTQVQASWSELQLGYGGTTTARTLDDKEARSAMREAQKELGGRLYQEMLDDPEQHAWAALLLSNCTPSSGRWLQYTGGATRRFQMGDALFKDALRLRCMLVPSEAAQIAASTCQCRPAAQRHATHLLDCASNQWFYTHRHNTACELLAALIRRVRPEAQVIREQPLLMSEAVREMDEEAELADEEGVHEGEGEGTSDGEEELGRGEEAARGNNSEDDSVEAGEESKEEEPEDQHQEHNASPLDVPPGPMEAPTTPPATTLDASGGAAVWSNRRSDVVIILPNAKHTIDVSFVNPGCRKYLRKARSHIGSGAAAGAREKEKRTKYADIPGMERGGREGFVPFAVEVTGRLGREALQFLHDIVPPDDTFHLSNFFSALSAMSAMHLSMMMKHRMRQFSALERIVF